MDAHWGWTRAAVSRLLTEGFSSEENPIPFELREQVWPGIVAGTLDPEPTPEQEREYVEKASTGKQQGESLTSATAFDPFTNSMNTPRGVAMEAVVRYALWVRSGFEKLKDNQSLAKGFDAIPEARDVLDLHLNPENDPSITIRTVYGQRAPWLHLLDEKWAQENTARIFARSRPELWHAAWDAIGGPGLIYEKFQQFSREVSLVGARSAAGETVFYPLSANTHAGGILRYSTAPYANAALERSARLYLKRVMNILDYIGVLTIEFFVVNGRLVANEMAPRVHNSGHWTIEGCVTSQFENHLRAICDLPLGSCRALGHAAMINFLGKMPDREPLLAIEGLAFHDYGKEPRPGRKLGHCTILERQSKDRNRALAAALKLIEWA